jgi:CBS domain-containing protein
LTSSDAASTIENYMSKNIVTMPDESAALDVAKLMVERKISSILLTDESNKIVGIITERDLLREICRNNLSAKQVSAKSMMSAPLLKIDKDLSIDDAARLMVEFRVRHVAVENKKDNELIGVITTSDLTSYIKRHVERNYNVPTSLFEALYCE